MMEISDVVSLLSEYGPTAFESVLPRLLGVLGEAVVCRELKKQCDIEAEVCPGNKRSVDLLVGGTKLRIQVKTSQTGRFVTRLTQKGFNKPDVPDLWVLFLVGKNAPRFFILTHEEICKAQKARNEAYAGKCAQRGKQPDFSKGVDNIRVEDVKQYEGQWSKISDHNSCFRAG